MNRCQFVLNSIACASMTAAASRLCGQGHFTDRKSVLVFGGTEFLGPQVVLAALDAGYDVTLCNRGITHPYLFPMLRKLRGTRRLFMK